MQYKGIIVIALVMAAVFSVGFWLTQISYKQKAPVTVENLSASFTLGTRTETSATVASENWGSRVTQSSAATPATSDAHITTQEDGLSQIKFGVDNDEANSLSDNDLGVVFDDLKLKVMLSATGENADTGWSGENHTITLVRDEQSVDNTAVFDNSGSGFVANKSLDIVYRALENTDNLISTSAPADETIPVEVWAKE